MTAKKSNGNGEEQATATAFLFSSEL